MAVVVVAVVVAVVALVVCLLTQIPAQFICICICVIVDAHPFPLSSPSHHPPHAITVAPFFSIALYSNVERCD